jgi:AraC-like DNA-binding protein
MGYWPYSDNQTRISLFNADKRTIVMEYILNDNTPYAGIGINLATQFPLLDLSGYSVLHINLSTERRTRFGVIIRTFEPGITEVKEEAFVHGRHKEIHLELDRTNNSIVISLKMFNDPDWWITENAIGKTLDKNPFRYAHVLQIFFDDMNLSGQKNRIELKEVSFHIFPAAFWLTLFIVISGYYCMYGTVFMVLRIKRRQKYNKEKLLSTYKKIERISHREKDTEAINRYIKNNYNDPTISLDTIVAATNLSRKRITTLIQQEFNMSLKECINWLRLEEAKRLLLETDLNITEIAYTLGFSSSSYFGVLFRNQEGISPKEFRKKQQSMETH